MRLARRVLLLAIAWPAAALAQVPAGSQFRVNTTTAGYQRHPAVAADASGGLVVVWDSQPQGVVLQRYRASGAPAGSEFRVAGAPQDGYPKVAATGGRFMVVWHDSQGISGRRFGAAGQPTGPAFRINEDTVHASRQPALSFAADGTAVVAWVDRDADGSGDGVRARRYDAAGAPMGPEFRVNTFTTGDQYHVSVAAATNGGFTVVWDSPQEGPRSVFGQRFDASGLRLGAEFRVNTATGSFETDPSIAMDASGNAVVAWGSDGRRAIFAQRYDAAGAPLGGEMRVSDPPQFSDLFGRPSTAMAPHGDFAVVWQDDPLGPGLVIKGRRFDASGAAMGAEFLVTGGVNAAPAAAMDPAGNFAVTWSTIVIIPDPIDVYAQRYGGLRPARLTVDTTAGDDSDGNRVLEACEAVDVVPGWSNFTGAPQTFSGAASAFGGPAGATYALLDGSAAYGTAAAGATVDCAAAADCYRVQVSCAPDRPAPHWDAAFREDIAPPAQGQAPSWTLHVGESFTDVPRTSGYYRFVETLLHRGVTGGCTSTEYCPGGPITRAAMSAFVLVAGEGAGYVPPACGAPLFADVPASDPFCRWIEELARRGVVSGCGGGNYCPAAAVTREQIPVFLLRVLDPALQPPACGTPLFADVPAGSPFCRWIEELARRGVVSGCGAGLYCPGAPVTREQMAVFVTVTFGLTLYGP